MKKRKFLSAALAAGLTFGSLSAVSYAEDIKNREASGYSITLENATVKGKEMAAVVFEGLPQEVFSFDYAHIDEKPLESTNGKDLIWISDFSDYNTIVHIDYGENQDIKIGAYSYNNWKAWSYDGEREDYQVVAENQENGTITVTTYFDLNNKYLRWLAGKEMWTVSVCVELLGYGHSALATGDAYEYVEIIPGKAIELHTLEVTHIAPTETIKVTNNLTEITPIEEKVFKPTVITENEGLDDDVKNTLRDITVTDSLGAFDNDVVMSIKGVSQTERSFSFDITFTKGGEEVQPRDKVTVKIPLPDFLKNYSTIVVRHYNEDGSLEKLSSKIENGFVIYSADHFSVYELSAQEQQNTNTNKPQSSGSSSSSKSSSAESPAPAASNTNPDTGISISLAPAILAAGAVVSALNNKKRR